ncbi:hypothetical protein AAEX28_06275 [Lentisphaerota bacterium WC36G]|nr:hypothetical protein LJT99_09140 [Lentisphaerae bacterium WC36]
MKLEYFTKKMTFKENIPSMILYIFLSNFWLIMTTCMCKIGGIKSSLEFKFNCYLLFLLLVQSMIVKVSKIDYILYYLAFFTMWIQIENYIKMGH